MPISLGPLNLLKELFDHPSRNSRKCRSRYSAQYRVPLVFFFCFCFFAVHVDSKLTFFNHICDSIHSVAVDINSRGFLTAQNKPQHHRQKQVRQASKENECRQHSILLSVVFLENNNYLSHCKAIVTLIWLAVTSESILLLSLTESRPTVTFLVIL